MKIHLLTRKEDLQTERLADKVVVVFDVLFATSTLVAVLGRGAKDSQGASEAWPVADVHAALRLAIDLPTAVCSGELHADTLPGFAEPTPLALNAVFATGAPRRPLIYATTNGTVALEGARGAAQVYAGALLNAGAVAHRLIGAHAGTTVLLVCAGSSGAMNLEDMLGAGACVERLVEFAGRAGVKLRPSDSAKTALLAYRGALAAGDMKSALRASAIGKLMLERGLAEELDFAAREDEFDGVPALNEGRLVWT